MCLKNLWLEPSNKCNLRCLMCRFRFINKGKKTISFSDYNDLLMQAKRMGVDNLNIGVTAEATQYENLSDFLNTGRHLGFRLNMITNLNFDNLNTKLFKSLSLVDHLFISIDAATKDTYEYIRMGSSWDLLVANLNRFGEFHNGNNVTARFVIQKKNIHEVSKFVDFIHNFQFFKEIIYEPVSINFVSERNRKLIEWSYKDLLLCKRELTKVYAKIGNYGLKCKDFDIEIIIKNRSLLLQNNYKMFFQKCFQDLYDIRFPINNLCYLLRDSLFVSPERQVYPCCSAYLAGELLLGDLDCQTLEEIWRSELVKKIRERLTSGIRASVCKENCFVFDGQT